MRRSQLLFSLLLLVFVTLPVAAQVPVWISPSAPTSTTPVTVSVSFTCFASDPSVSVVGSVIKVNWASDSCGSVPIPTEYSVALPSLLAPGEYRVDVTFGSQEIAGSMKFIVRDSAPKPFVIHPFAVPAGGIGSLKLRLSSASSVCPGGVCTIRVGGVAVAEKTLTDDDAILFDAPPHAPGLVDVDVQVDDFIQHSRAALYYFDGTGPPDTSVFERILFPVLFSGSGVAGSQWLTEAVVSNPRPWFVWNYNTVFPFVCIGFPCGERLSPASTERFNGQGYPNGVALLVPREEANDLAFSLRARDVSRETEGLGTQLPVVRESAMFRDTMTLLNVPLDPRYRVKLRVYALDAGFAGYGPTADMTLRRIDGSRSFFGRILNTQCTTCGSLPHYTEIDFPAGVTGELADLYIHLSPGYLGWAFVTVTNNSTQQVTIVTPDGAGGQPCTNCTP